MSKVANRELTISPKVVKDQAQPRNSGKVVKPTKMNEDYQQRKDDFTHQSAEEHKTGLQEISEAHSEQLTSLQLSPEMLFQQRQKTELRRLLKHTCPELKRLDDAVDEEFAEVLSSEMKLGSKTGYEGEVLSRCMIFESRNLSSNNNPKIYVAEGGLESKQYRKTPSDFERLKEEPKTKEFELMLKSDKSPNLTSDFNKDVEEEMVEKDAQVSRKLVENQSSSTHKQNEIQGNAPLVFKKEIIAGKIMEQSEAYSAIMPQGDNKSMEKDSEEKAPCVNRICQSATNDSSCSIAFSGYDFSLEEFSKGLPDSEIKNKTTTNSDLFQNNPFISTNTEQQNSYCHASKTHTQSSLAEEGYPIANVKNRAHLFESMPFDKIRHQNQDEMEMLVENIKETLDFLHHVKAIHSDGAIIEVNETMIAKKSKFTISDQGPELKYDEFAEGGTRNFIVQLLPRVNLKHQIIYLKEDSKGLMKTTVLDALAHQHHFSANKDTELKTANVIQLVEDILNQDNSLRKGVIIQEDASKYGEVIVYSLYKYFDEKDVKSYIPPKGAEHEEPETHTELLSKSVPDPSFSGSVRPNVKLLKSYIEKGDLEYLRSLHDDEPTFHRSGLSQNQAALKQDDECQHEQQSDSAEECIQVDVKTLKNMFSEGKSPIHSKSSAVSSGKSQSPVECNTEVFLLPQHMHRINTCFVQDPKKIVAHSDSHNDNRVHEPEMAEVVNVNDKVSDLKTAYYSHDQAENESCFQEIYTEGLSEIPIANAIADTARRSKTDSEAYQSKESTVLNQSETNLTAMVYPQCSEETSLQEEDKTCYKGTIQAALNSLERSNINITRGDFKAAMIYRHCYESNKKTSPKDVQKNNTTDLCPMCKLSQEQPKQELTWENKNPHQTKEPLNLEETVTNADPPYQSEEPLNLEVSFVNAEPPNLTEELLNQEVTVANVEPPHPSIKSSNLVLTVANAESPQPNEDTLNLEVIVADKEPLHQTEELLNVGMAVANAKLLQPTKETLNLEVVTGNVKPPRTAEGRLNLEVNVANVAPFNPTEGPVNIEGTLENAESPDTKEDTPNLKVIVVNEDPPPQIEEPLNQRVAMTYAKLPRPNEETLNVEVTVANMEPCNPSKEQESSVANVESPNPIQVSVNIEATAESVRPPHPTEKQLNLELTVENGKPSDQNKSSLNLEGTLINAEPRFTSEKLLNLELAVANAEPSHPFEKPQNPHVAVANAVLPQQSKEPLNSGKTILNSVENNCTATQGAVLKRSKRVIGPKPPIPPKPEHLKANHAINQPSPTKLPEGHKISNVGTKETTFQVPQPSITTPILNQEGSISRPVDNHENQNLGEGTKMLHETQGKSEVQSLTSVSENNGNIIKNINGQHKTSIIGKEEVPQTTSANNICDTDETHINFHEACQKFGGKGLPLKKMAPVKPKRVKPIQSSDKSQKHLPGESTRDGIVQMRANPLSNAFEITADRVDSIDKDTEQKNKVAMREKKATTETEDENRQRLSIHMNEIVRGNVTAAMQIFEHLRKQEQLESILSRVKEIESDTSKVDVRSLRRVFENIPDWVVNTDKKRQTKVRIKTNDKSMQLPADIKNKSSMEYIYGDLERASEEIIHLKEQTLARLKDIEDTIKKALFSVSTLKSDSDIASLSNLFKESLGVAEGSSFSSNINKSGLSRTKPQEPQESSLPEKSTSTGAAPSPTTDTFSTMQGQSPPSSPAFVSIQSIARKTDDTETAPQDMSICMKCQMNSRPEGKFRTMKTVSCNSPTSGKKDPSNGGQKQMSKCQQNREVSVLQVKTDSGGSVTGATVEKYERTDYSGNQLYTSTVSAVVATQPETITSQAVVSPETYQL